MATVKQIERANEILAGLRPVNTSIGAAGITLYTMSGSSMKYASLGYIARNNGRANKHIVVRYALERNGVSEEDIDFLIGEQDSPVRGIVDLNWFDNSIVEDILDLCGPVYLNPRGVKAFWDEPRESLRRR